MAGTLPYALEVTGLVKRYGRTTVLRGLDLKVPWGECLVLFGPNGSGKTTLIKLLAGLSKSTKGSISIAGRDLPKHATSLRRLIGVVSHQSFLYGDLTGYENLQFFGRLFQLESLDTRIHETANLMEIEEQLHHKVRTLSHGMQKRIALARALLHDPPILLLDEAETGLDQGALQAFDRVLTTRGRHRTIVMTTHNLDRGLALGSQIALLAKGRIMYEEKRALLDETYLRDIYAELSGVH